VSASLLVNGAARRRVRTLAVPVAAAAAPIAYEWVLTRADAAWRINADQTSAGRVPWWMLVVTLLPLAALAFLGVRGTAPGPLRIVLVSWPLAALGLYLFGPGFRYHALNGITIPLAVLAVIGWRRIPRRGAWLGAAAAVAVSAPAAAFEITTFRDSERAQFTPYWFTSGEHAALRSLERNATPGGVLARYYMGMAVPAFTGRRTWVGSVFWTPHFAQRSVQAEQLFRGELPQGAAQALVRQTGARFVLQDCRAADVGHLLGPLVATTQRFGCAAVYEVRG
jgi:hypothetical protein